MHVDNVLKTACFLGITWGERLRAYEMVICDYGDNVPRLTCGNVTYPHFHSPRSKNYFKDKSSRAPPPNCFRWNVKIGEAMSEVVLHRLKYMLSPQMDLYRNIAVDNEWRQAAMALDVGCGTGASTLQLIRPEWAVMGIDVDDELIAFAQEMWGHLALFEHLNLEHKQAGQGTLADVIACIEVLEHVLMPEVMLDNMANILRPGGTLYVSMPNAASQVRKNDSHVKEWSVTGFADLLRPLEGVKITDYQLETDLDASSTVTPMVGVWRKP